MPKIINKKTGKEETVTAEQMKALQENPLLADKFDYIETPEPAEVTELKKTEPKPSQNDNT